MTFLNLKEESDNNMRLMTKSDNTAHGEKHDNNFTVFSPIIADIQKLNDSSCQHFHRTVDRTQISINWLSFTQQRA